MRKGTVILWLVVLTASLALVSGCADPKKVGVSEANVQAEFLAMKAAGEKERGGYKLISLQELKEKLDAKEDMLVVDTMPYEASYKKQHIPTSTIRVPNSRDENTGRRDGEAIPGFARA